MSKIFTTIALSALLLVGCAQTKALFAKYHDGSLGYANAKKLPPIRLPLNQQTAAFTPLYDVPDTEVPSDAVFTNTAGTQYQLPAPPNTVKNTAK